MERERGKEIIHDVDQRQLQQSLAATTESCVNRVGVDLNTASWMLLRYVAGVSERVALNIVSFRDQNGRFRSRAQLREVSGVGPKTFEQAAGFLRVRNGEHPLDNTAVHPESYALVEQIAQSLGTPISDLIKNPQPLAAIDKKRFSAGTFTLNDILEELKKPGRDPRDTFVAPSFSESVRELSDVEPGMVLEGVVTNVTKFGAFIDIGVHQDGLVHISEIANRFIKEPAEVLKAGQTIVKVDEKYFRPTEVDLLIGDASKAKEKLGWVPQYDLEALVEDMVQADLHLVKKDDYLKKGGFKTLNYFE